MKNFHILLLVLFGFLLIPNATYACKKKNIQTEKLCCKKETSSKTEKKSCCDEKKKSKKECEGKCGHSNCTTSTVQLSLAAFNEIEFKTSLFDFATKKAKNRHNETDISSGFYFIWLPPKIN